MSDQGLSILSESVCAKKKLQGCL